MRTYAVAMLLALLFPAAAYAGDGYQGRPSVCANIPSGPRADRCRQWVWTAKRPDILDLSGNPYQSCCGEADLFIADDFELGSGGELYAIITADYPDVASTDEEGNTVISQAKIHRGSKILIPPEKLITRAEDANRSSHGAVFILASNGEVVCYTRPPLT